MTDTNATRAEVRDEVRTWAEQSWDPDLTVAEWWERLAESGWAVPTWPTEWYGKGLSRDLGGAASAGLADAGALGPPGGLSVMLAGPTILAHGSDEQKEHYLEPIANGQHAWCQLFSEPGAGSDLASIQANATQDGDEWVVSGQKVWTSGGGHADLGMLLARTNADAPKHKGISYFAVEMVQSGIEVRPLREMTGRALFSEVFLDEARVADDAMIGDLNGGWGVAMTTLVNERAGLGGGGGASATSPALPGQISDHLGRRAGDFVSERRGRTGTGAALRGGAHEIIQSVATESDRIADPRVRQELMRLYSFGEISKWAVLRAKADKAKGTASGAEANIAKLIMSRMTRLSRDLGLAVLGADGMIMGQESRGGGIIQELALFAPAVSIYGGTDEVQKNIIGERVLGLPKEPSDAKNTPFKDLLVGTQA